MFTMQQVTEAAKSAKSIADVARALGIRDTKSGRLGKSLRGLMPNLDEILKANRGASKGSTESVAKQDDKPTTNPPTTATINANPYREGSGYHVLFQEGSKKHWDKTALIAHVAKLTNSSQRVVGFSLAVLCNAQQQSNGGRSACIKDDQGRIKLICVKPKATKAA